MNPNTDTPGAERQRSFLTRTEIAILLGMVLCVASLFLTWRRVPLDPSQIRAMPTALVLNLPKDRPLSGFEMPLHWPLTFCAVFCAVGLLVQPKSASQARWAAAQVISAAICLLLPIVRFALQPGVLVALLGGGLILFGVLERFGNRETPQSAKEP